ALGGQALELPSARELEHRDRLTPLVRRDEQLAVASDSEVVHPFARGPPAGDAPGRSIHLHDLARPVAGHIDLAAVGGRLGPGPRAGDVTRLLRLEAVAAQVMRGMADGA